MLKLIFSSTGHQQQLATYTEGERDSWVSALQAASHSRMRQHLASLQNRLKTKLLSMGLTSEAEAIEISDGNANADEATLKHNASVIGQSFFLIFSLILFYLDQWFSTGVLWHKRVP